MGSDPPVSEWRALRVGNRHVSFTLWPTPVKCHENLLWYGVLTGGERRNERRDAGEYAAR